MKNPKSIKNLSSCKEVDPGISIKKYIYLCICQCLAHKTWFVSDNVSMSDKYVLMTISVSGIIADTTVQKLDTKRGILFCDFFFYSGWGVTQQQACAHRAGIESKPYMGL
jgi:hypothetical protein